MKWLMLHRRGVRFELPTGRRVYTAWVLPLDWDLHYIENAIDRDFSVVSIQIGPVGFAVMTNNRDGATSPWVER